MFGLKSQNWVQFSVKREWEDFVVVQSLSHVQLFATPWTVAHQAPLSTGLSRQEHWSRLPFPPPGDHPDPGIKSTSLVSCTGRRRSLPLVPAGKPILNYPNHNTRTPCIGAIIFQGIRRLRRWFIFGSLVPSWHTAGT